MMKSYLSTMCYIIPEGSTQEETCAWEELKARVEQGHLTLETLLYIPDTKEWVRLGTMEEFRTIAGAATAGASEDGEERCDGSDTLAEEYQEIKRQLQEQQDSQELILKAGRTALGLGKLEEASGYFQRALELYPFNQRIANEIKQSFSPAVFRTFQLLDRKPPYWEDPMAAVAFALRNGWKWYAIVAPALSALLFVPWADTVYWLVLALLCIHAARETGAGACQSFPADAATTRALFGSWKALTGLVLAGGELLVPCMAAAAVALVLEGAGRWNVFAYIANSPLMAVVLFAAGAMYLPAVLMRNADARARLADSANPRRMFKIIAAMQMEYPMLVIGVAAVAVAWVALRMILSPVPVVREVISTGAGLFGLALIGNLSGLAFSRYTHLFRPSAQNRASDLE